MQTSISTSAQRNGLAAFLKRNGSLIAIVLIMIALPFVVALLDGRPFSDVLANETGNAKFVQGLMIEIFILAIYAISYDLILGITGLLSFGHAMFFAVGAYGTGIMLKNLEWGILPTLGGIFVLGVLQALLFAVVLPRVKGITFALVTLGLASVFQIVVQSNEVGEYTGADVGLQGVIPPDFLNTSTERFHLYLIGLALTVVIYLVYRRFVDSPTGRVCVAIRENEDRALMLGYNTFYFKLAALIVSSITAALAGTLHTLHQPIVSPNVASLSYTVLALLIILIGGMGTLSGAMIGAAVFRLLEYFLDKQFSENASFILGLIYVLLVMFVPYGIVGTWQVKRLQIQQGRARLYEALGLRKKPN
ncbi:MAG: branched-chain amino acid ABC transporter permease [Ardenticatenaceae bacterium]|nr:branched-chain amino acid ABC transporter permease [Anaerolineales bacterium]MCB8923790.1 branched-chain amino acid ABC transporter permease [Ardenticatenaceae bacterium]MCB8990125.1 branched-chain amino acid ABC transporter permease [Ardenticatenaceae bacterium]